MATSLPSLPPLTGDTSWIDNPTGMEGLPVPIAPARPIPPIGTGSSSSTSNTWADWPPKAKTPADSTNVIPKWLSNIVAGTFEAYIGRSLEDIIFIIVGIILVAAAVFSFKETQTVVKTVVKTAGRAAEVAA